MINIKKILFLGDSITEGAGASKIENNYVNKVGEKLGVESLNFGVGGTRIAKQNGDGNDRYAEYFLLRAKKMPKDADLVFVFGGTNDFGHGDAPIGNINDKTDLTFYGALNNLIEYLIETFGKEKIRFILPLARFDQDNPFGEGNKKAPSLTLKGYVDIIREVLDEFGIGSLDLSDSFIKPLTNKGDRLTVDGLHPNDLGHKIIADKIVEYIQKI
jgi:lysophospholipase L1-like esterase